jgi:hypothetical protein
MVKTTQLFAKQKRKATVRKKQSTRKGKRSKLNKKTKKTKTQSRRNVKNKTTKKLIKRKKTRKSRKVMKGGVLTETEKHKPPITMRDNTEKEISKIAYNNHLTDDQAEKILKMNLNIIKTHNMSQGGYKTRADPMDGLFLCRDLTIFYTDKDGKVLNETIKEQALKELINRFTSPFAPPVVLKMIIIPNEDLGHTMEEVPPVVDRATKPNTPGGIYESATDMNTWFRGVMARGEAEADLKGKSSGTFLIRKSQTNPEQSVLSFNDNGYIRHHIISHEMYGISPDEVFATIPAMVKHYTEHSLSRHLENVSDQFKLIH